MSFDPTFGSFGDFLSIAILIKEICVALNESRGSARNYQDLIQQLEILAKAIQALAVYLSSQRTGSDSESVTILQIVEQIRILLEEFHDRLRKYAPSLSPGGSGNAWKDAGRKLQFRMEEGDFEKFLTKVKAYTMLLQPLIGVTIL